MVVGVGLAELGDHAAGAQAEQGEDEEEGQEEGAEVLPDRDGGDGEVRYGEGEGQVVCDET